jgi:hypothetical protein
MWIGLLDKNGEPYHPKVVGRCDADAIRWRLDYLHEGALRLSNRDQCVFRVFRAIEAPSFYAFFREVDDIETFYVNLPLSVADRGRGYIGAGAILTFEPGAFAIRLPRAASK